MKKLLVTVTVLCVVFVCGFAAYRGYKIWKEQHLVKMARVYVAKTDISNALLCLRQALYINPNNLEACRLMATLAEAARSPQAVVWRSRLVELQPDSLVDRLALVRTAMSAGDNATAEKALEGVREPDRKTADYQEMAGAYDLANHRLEQAEEHFSEAARLEQTNAACQLNLATLRLHKVDPVIQAEARASMHALTKNPQVRMEALRRLTVDALRNTNTAAALAYSGDLLKETNAVFTDRMVHLDILRVTTNAGQQAFLTELQAEAAGNPAKAYEVSKWMIRAAQPGPALAWLQSLPLGTRTNPPVPLAEADCYLVLTDWAGFLTNSAGQNWGELDCLRLACRARAFREQGSTASAKTEWLAALKATDNKLPLLGQLLHTTGVWKWAPEQEDVLWAVVNRYPKESWATRTLAERFHATGRTRSLLSLFGVALQNQPDDLVFMNNLAMTAILTEAWDKSPHQLAREVYTKNPTNASFVSTYAFSLLVQEKPEEALKIIQQLRPEQLNVPTTAAYYGLILKAVGKTESASNYFEIASKARLLPEEQKLIDKAKAL